MNLKKPKFWDYKRPNIFAYLLSPIALLIQLLSVLKIKSKITKLNIKTICVGNIYLGGTGKTSLSIKINEILNKKNIKSCFVKKFYKNQIDEQKLLKSRGKLFLFPKRLDAINQAEKENYEIAILDDGLQDKTLNIDVSFVCFNNLNWIGNGLTIPSGPLRENLSSLRKYDAVFFNGNNESETEFEYFIKKKFTHLKIFKSQYKIKNNENFDKKDKYLVFAGIGNFENLIEMLKINNFSIIKSLNYPDHYNYKQYDIDRIKNIANENNAKIITTEKDFVKISHENQKNIKKIEVELEIINKDDFTNFLNKKI